MHPSQGDTLATAFFQLLLSSAGRRRKRIGDGQGEAREQRLGGEGVGLTKRVALLGVGINLHHAAAWVDLPNQAGAGLKILYSRRLRAISAGVLPSLRISIARSG